MLVLMHIPHSSENVEHIFSEAIKHFIRTIQASTKFVERWIILFELWQKTEHDSEQMRKFRQKKTR